MKISSKFWKFLQNFENFLQIWQTHKIPEIWDLISW
jgi:hypothetical protein